MRFLFGSSGQLVPYGRRSGTDRRAARKSSSKGPDRRWGVERRRLVAA
jgi:hypothetical protein